MKNLVLFEAFKTDKLNKTLGFINSKTGRDKFRNDLKTIGVFYDFPISDFDDDMFHYLGYQKALKLINYPNAKKCEFSHPPSDKKYIAGEICKDGRLKRKWGANGERNMACPACNGTGERKPTKRNQYLKFWFNSDGVYNGATITNSVKGSVETTFSKNLDDYEAVKEFASGAAMKRETENGEQIKINIYRDTPGGWRSGYSNPTGDIVATIIKKGTQVYAIQDDVYGNIDTWYFRRIMDNWNNFGRRIANISSPQSYVGRISLLQRSNASTDPLYWNHAIDLNTMKASIGGNKESILDDATFAIVLDLDKIPAEFESVGEIKDKRNDARAGALALETDNDIKKANIKKYLDKISQNSKVDLDNLENLNMTFRRLLGFNNNVWQRAISGNNGYNNIKNVVDNVYKAMANDDVEQVKYDIDNVILPRIRRGYADSGDYAERTARVRDKIRNYGKNSNRQGDVEKADEMIELINKWSLEANKKLATIKINNISDAMIFHSKASQILVSDFPVLNVAMGYLSRISGGWGGYENYFMATNLDEFKRDMENQIQYVKNM